MALVRRLRSIRWRREQVRIDVDQMRDPPAGDRPVEVVERKGIGHPDTICDALAEEVSRTLSRWYLERFGSVLHHNVDKALLCGGSATARFGGGEVTAPIEIVLAGRATRSFGGVEIPVEDLAIESCQRWLRRHLHALDPERHVRIQCRFRPGSADLTDLFARGAKAARPRANDTSIGVGFAPLSPLERTVLDLESWLNSPEVKQSRPETGEDVKVLGVRHLGEARLTVACAFVSRYVASAAEYLAKKAALASAIRGRVDLEAVVRQEVVVNAADDPSANSVYLTVTGTSAEAGDDGQVGRGNRANGLITPGRPMTLEAAAGKNPASHVGKLYNVAAGVIAQDLVAASPDITGAECVLVSEIGAPIDEPRVVSVRLAMRDRPASTQAPIVRDVARRVLQNLPALSDQLRQGAIAVY
jgi:S-adenosylmethionine synthetase